MRCSIENTRRLIKERHAGICPIFNKSERLSIVANNVEYL